MSDNADPSAGEEAVSLASEEKLAFAARFSSDLFAYLGSEGRVELYNSAFQREFGSDEEDVEGKPITTLFRKEEFAEVFRLHFSDCLDGNQTYTEYHHSDGEGIDKHFGIQFVPYFTGEEVTSVLVLFRDISYIRRLEDKVQLLEYHDRKTGLPNRRSLNLALEKEIAKNRRKGPEARMAVLYISLENFARINQTYGHEIGDILLENSGLRIKESLISELLRDSDYVFETAGEEPRNIAEDIEPIHETAAGAKGVSEAGSAAAGASGAAGAPGAAAGLTGAPGTPGTTGTAGLTGATGPEGTGEVSYNLFRFEGKEFAAILSEISRETDAAIVASRIAKNVSQPYYDKFGAEIFINCNIGISVYPGDGDDRETLIQHAASAMHEAKRREMDFLLFNPDLHERALEKIRLGGNIYNAFIESQFELYYQPIVDYLGEIVGAEALIRWNHPERGVVPPSEFLPLAEEKGIIVNIGKWALYAVLKQLERWPKDIYITLNMSGRELDDSQAVDSILKAVRSSPGTEPRRLKIEVSESVWTRDPERFLAKMQKIVAKGVDIQVDNYGTGATSLMSLKTLPARTLKIDRTFLKDICSDEEDFKFLESIVNLAYNRKKTVVIEGVELREQAEMIRRLKPVYMQGYYFSGPVPAYMFERLVNRRVRLPVSE